MALQEILSQVEETGQKQVEEIRTKTKSEVESKLSEARDKGKAVSKEIDVETLRQIEQLEQAKLDSENLFE